MITLFSRRALAVACSALLMAVTPAFADQPVPGVDISLQQNPGALIVGTGRTNGDGAATIVPPGPGTYNVLIVDPAQLRTSVVVTVKVPGMAAIVSDPINPREAAAKKSAQGYIAAKGGGALTVEISPPRSTTRTGITVVVQAIDETRNRPPQRPGR